MKFCEFFFACGQVIFADLGLRKIHINQGEDKSTAATKRMKLSPTVVKSSPIILFPAKSAPKFGKK